MNEQLILGTLLGDGCISKLYGKSTSHKLSWEHSLKQKEYALWKAEELGVKMYIYERSRLDKRTTNTYHSITLYNTHKDYYKYRILFYPEGVKILTRNILNQLSPYAIAIWFMDDGNLYYNGNNCHLTLSTECFDSKLIIDYFKETWGLTFKETQNRIRLTSVKEVKKFEALFSSYYHKSMDYKKLEYAKQKHKKRKNPLLG